MSENAERFEITAHSIVKAAQSEGKAAFVVLGGGSADNYKPSIYSPGDYRTNLELAWKQALAGHTISQSVLSDAYAISPPAYACTNYRCDVLAEVPPAIFKRDGSISDFNPVPLFMDSYPTLIWLIEASLIIYGVSYLRKVYNSFNYPSGLEWLHPDDVDPETDVDGNVINYYIDAVKYETFQMVEIRTFDPNRAVKGLPEFQVAMTHITTDQAIIRHAGSYFFNSARPDGMLISKQKMSPADIKRAEADWKSFKGSKNTWKTFISSGQWEWIPLTGAPVDLAMTELSTDTTRKICAILKTNPALVGFADVSDPLSAGSTMTEIKRNHIENVSLPRFNIIARALNEQWLYPDFGHSNLYSIGADRAKMPILSQITGDKATTSTTLVGGQGSVVADYDETRATMNLPPRGGDYIKRNPVEANTIFLNTGLTLDQYRKMLGLEEYGAFNGGDLVRLPSGVLIRQTDLPKAADAMLQALLAAANPPPASPFGGGFTISTPPGSSPPGGVAAPPAPPAQPPPSNLADKKTLGKLARLIIMNKRSGNPTGGAYVLLSLANNPSLMAIQTLLKGQLGEGGYTDLVEPKEFHVTVVCADNVSPQTEQALYPVLSNVPYMQLATGGLTTFAPDENGIAPLVMLIDTKGDGGAALLKYQADLYKAIQTAQPDAALSDYSDPAGYKPHITFGWVDAANFKLPDLAIPVTVEPSAVQFSREVFEITYQTPVKLPPAPDKPPPDTPAPETQRAATSIQLAAVWPENNFILMAQRIAAAALQDGGVNAVTWYPPNNWTLPFATFNGSAGDANRVLNNYNLSDSPRLDLTGYKFAILGNQVGLMCDPAEALGKLNASVRLQLEESGYEPESKEFAPFIPLGEFTDQADSNSVMDSYNALNAASSGLGMPLVLSSVDLLVNGESRNSWALRAFSSSQKTELEAWKRKATGRRGADSSFQTSALTGTLAGSYVRAALTETDPNNREAVLAIFSRAQKVLTNGIDYLDIPDAPDEYAAYWKNFDNLQHDLGAAWLGYMKKATPHVLGMLSTDTNPTSIMAPMAKLHAGLAAEWVGTEEKPGDLVKLILAGMAAGNDALNAQINMNPDKTTRAGSFGLFPGNTQPGQKNVYGEMKPGSNITLDWDLLNKEAYDFARTYSYELIKGLDQTTQQKVQVAFGDWLKSGEGLPALTESLTPIFNDANRAGVIAQTESIRSYNEGAFKRWQDVGVTKAVWRTVQDPKVCPICRPLNGQVADIQTGWIHPGGSYIDPYDNQRVNGEPFRGASYRASAHPGCRCFRRPVVIFENGNTAGKPEQQTGEQVTKTRFAGKSLDQIFKESAPEFEQVRAKLVATQIQFKTELAAIRTTRDAAGDLADQLDDEWSKVNRARILEKGKDNPDPARLAELLAQQADIETRLNKAKHDFLDSAIALDDKVGGLRGMYRDALKQGGDFRTQQDFTKGEKFTDKMRAESDKANEFLTNVMDGEQFTDGMTVNVKRQTKGLRAFAAKFGNSINMTQDDGASIWVHEIGHHIEYNYPDVHDRAIEFLLKRSKGEAPRPLSEIYPRSNYKPGEIAVQDGFKDAYAGKYYYDYPPKPGQPPDNSSKNLRSSELISMGLQYMYEDAADFAQNDPEYFNFILAIMRRFT